MNKFSIKEYLEIIRIGITNEDYKQISNNKLFKILREKGIFIEKNGFKNVPNNKVREAKLFDYEKNYYEAENKWNLKPLITEKGAVWLTQNLFKSGYIKSEVDFKIAYSNSNWTECDTTFLLNNLLNEKYIFQYNSNSNKEWYGISSNLKIEVLHNIKNKGYKIRYNTKIN